MISMTSQDFGMRASLGFVKDYMENNPDKIQDPSQDYDLLLDMFENDPILTVAFDTTVDVATSHGFEFTGKSETQIENLSNKFNDVLDFDSVLPNIIYNMIIYGDAYLELRRLNGKISELHVLETTEMKIKYDLHGRILGYVQQPAWMSPDMDYPEWKPNEILHFTFKKIGSQVYSSNPLKSIYRSYQSKKYADNYLAKIFANFPPRLLYILKNSSPSQTKQFIEGLKQAKLNPHKDMIGLGDIEVKENGIMSWDTGLTEVLNWLRQEILMITKVPPIWVGIPDNSNRSNSEAQIRSFETRIKGIHRKIESEINKILLPELGFTGYKFKFSPFSLGEEKGILENAKILQEMGARNSDVEKYLYKHGVNVKITKPPIKSQNSMNNKTNQGMGGMSSNNLDQNGASSESKKKLEKMDEGVRADLDTVYELDQYKEYKNGLRL